MKKIDNINSNYLNKNLKIRKFAATLTLIGGLIITTGCGNNKNKFDYQQNNGTFSKQYEDEYDYDIPKNEEFYVNQLSNYCMAYEDYQNNKNDIQKRVNLVSETRNLIKISDNLLEEKIKSAIDNKEENKIQIKSPDYSTNDISVIIKSNYGYDIDGFIFKNKDIADILRAQTNINIYEGTGENSAWNSAIKEFNRYGQALYNNIIDIINKEYTYDNGELSQKKETK